MHNSYFLAWGSHQRFCRTSNKPDIRINLGQRERWSQIRLELPLEQEGGKQIRLELSSRGRMG